jgi:hypothetical protein
MKRHRKMLLLAVLAVAVCSAAVVWVKYKRNSNEKILVEDAKSCRVLAQRGDADAEYRLGRIYDHGMGVPPDPSEAARWYGKAAEQGHARAENGLGFLYSHGRGVPQDSAQAVLWYRKAAEQGYASAQYNLGLMYLYGKGVAQDRKEADLWLQRAADQGDRDAGRILSTAAGRNTRYIILSLAFLVSLLFLIGPSLSPRRLPYSRQSIVGRLLGAAGMTFVGLSLYGLALPDMGYSALAGTFNLIKCSVAVIAIGLAITLFLIDKKPANPGPHR